LVGVGQIIFSSNRDGSCAQIVDIKNFGLYKINSIMEGR
jgi:hypothetical protein